MKNETLIRIPVKYQSMLEEVYSDCDGYWTHSKKGFYFQDTDSHTSNSRTQKGLLKSIRMLAVCECEECKC